MKRLSKLKLIHVIKAFEIALCFSVIYFVIILDNWEDIILSGFSRLFINYAAGGGILFGLLLGGVMGFFGVYCCDRANVYRKKRRLGVILDRTVIGAFALDALLVLLTWRQTEELMVLPVYPGYPVYSLVYDCIVITFFALTMRYRKAYSKR